MFLALPPAVLLGVFPALLSASRVLAGILGDTPNSRLQASDGPSSAELVRAKRDTKIDTASFERNLPVAARIIGIALVNGRTLEDLKAWPEQIAAVTAEQVREAARAVFLSDRSVTGVLSPK